MNEKTNDATGIVIVGYLIIATVGLIGCMIYDIAIYEPPAEYLRGYEDYPNDTIYKDAKKYSEKGFLIDPVTYNESCQQYVYGWESAKRDYEKGVNESDVQRLVEMIKDGDKEWNTK